MTARRFEFRDAKSAKFWEIEAAEHRTITTWGRLGTDGQTKAKEFASPVKAAADADKKIAEKLKKGYTEVGEVAGASAPPAAPEPKAPPAVKQPVAKPAARAAVAEVAATAESGPASPGVAERSPALADIKATPEPAHDGVTMSAAWQRNVLPRRGKPTAQLPLYPKPDLARAKDVLASAFAPLHEYTEQALQEIGKAELFNLMLKNTDQLDPEDPQHRLAVALSFRITRSRNHNVMRKNAHHWVDDWVATHGLVFALRVLEEARRWVVPVRGFRGKAHSERLERQEPSGVAISRPSEATKRLRHHIAIASEQDYADVRPVGVEIGSLGGINPWRAAILFPSETDLVEQAFTFALSSAPHSAQYLLSLVETTEQLDAILAVMRSTPTAGDWEPNNVPTLLAHLGTDLVPYLGCWLTGQVTEDQPSTGEPNADSRKAYVQALRFAGTEDAIRSLAAIADHKHVLPGLTELAHEHPHAAIRALAPLAQGGGAQAKTVSSLLRNIVREHPGAAIAVLPDLSDRDRGRVEQAGDRSNEKPPAPNELVHPLLIDPPWNNRVDMSDRTVVPDVEMIRPPARLALPPSPVPTVRNRANDPDPDWDAEAAKLLAGYVPPGSGLRAHSDLPWFFAGAPLELVTTTLAEWELPSATNRWVTERVANILIQRLGAEVLPTLEKFAETNMPAVIDLVEQIASAGLAMPFADAFERMKLFRTRAADWLELNADLAIYGLIPCAVGPNSTERKIAANTLRFLARSGRDAIEKVAAGYGPQVQQAVAEILDFDELQVLPKHMPKPPEFASLSTMTLPLLADRQHQLPADAASNLLTMLAITKPGEPYPGLGIVLPTLDPASTAAFGWELFEAWQSAGMPSKHGWVLGAQGHLGNDDTVRQLTPIIRAWPGEGGHKRAVNGLDALADIGTDLALMQLFGMSRKLKFKGLKKNAAEKVQQIAEQRDLTPEQLADRLVPDLDLDADGSVTLDYGSRTFTVGFDEQLKPFVRDEAGKIRKALPKPAQKDDAELAPLAYKQFSALKKDARAVAADQLVRLEQAMVQQRRWTRDEFNEYFVDHPLIIHLVRRLVWGVYVDGAVAGSFRVAEDRSLADAHDDTFTLADDAIVGIVHPLDMDQTALAAWGELLSDYETLQPFQQVARETFEMTPAEMGAALLTRFTGPSLPFGKYLGLEKKGWIRGTPQDAGICPNLYRRVSDDLFVHVELESGLWTGYIQETPDQPIHGVSISTASAGWYSRSSDDTTFAALSPVSISELLRDLTDLFA